ncbi:MAG: PEP/pyruvate-binding domain-containing protein [Hyphomicrobiaceae bacterium]
MNPTIPTKKFIHSPDDACDVSDVGGKAAALARLVARGFNVPAFFAIDASSSGDIAESDIAPCLARLGEGPFAVRSSGPEEDGAAHSHAGQFLSLLNVTASDIPAAVHQVWESGATESLKSYRTSHGLDPDGGAPAVIVQRMVDARAAGVAFSADPVSGRRDRVVVSATEGLGDRLVSGEIDGEQYIVETATGKVVTAPDEAVALSKQDVTAVVDLACRVEQALGAPQDIEWAFDSDRLYLLQARAITTELRAPANDDTTVTVFDNSNIIESYPGLVTPLTFSFAQYAYARVYRAFLTICGVNNETVRSNSAALENMLGRIDGRVYYNLINWYRLLALLPGFSLNRSHMETMMGVDEPLPVAIADALAPPPAKGFAAIREWAKVARMGGKLAFEAIRLPRTVRQFHDRLNAALDTDASAIDKMSLAQLASYYRRIEATLLDRWDAPLINDFLCMIAFGGSRKLTERWIGPAGLELHNDVMIGQGDIISAEPPRRIARMGRMIADDDELIDALEAGDATAIERNSELAKAVGEYIAKFGDRCTEELKLESITLDVNPKPLLASIAGSARDPKNAPAHQSGGIERLNTLLVGKPLKRWALKRVLDWAKARVRDRENLRFERTRIFGQARRVFLAMGQQLHAIDRLAAPRDIFLLTVQEALGAIEGFGHDRDLKVLATMRRQQFEVDRQRPAPSERLTFEGAVIAQDISTSEPVEPVDVGNLLKGTGCSAGVVTAKARVVRDPANEKLERGEVLVAQHTDPGWIALFANASAIVVERGSLLSHSAIVARELGLPCVVGLKGAMSAIQTGGLIEVDGGSGIVRKFS